MNYREQAERPSYPDPEPTEPKVRVTHPSPEERELLRIRHKARRWRILTIVSHAVVVGIYLMNFLIDPSNHVTQFCLALWTFSLGGQLAAWKIFRP